MRVLELFEAAEGGVPEQVGRLTAGLGERGHEVTVAGPPHSSKRPRLSEAAREYVPLDLVGSLVAPGNDLRALCGLIGLLRGGRFDVVHAHGLKPALLARAVAPFFGVPVAYTPHGFVYRFQHLRPRRTSGVRAALILGAERLLRGRLAALIAVSAEEQRAASEDGVAPAERVFLVENGVAPELDAAPDPVLVAFREDGPLFGIVAGLRDQKGLPTLLDALELLAGRQRAVRFAIVGNGPLEPMVRGRVQAEPLAATTILLPFAGRVEPYLAALDAFVLPSYWEGMPIALLEAAAMGLPAVASAVNGTVEVVEEGRTGLLVPSHDPAALAEAIDRLAGDASLRAEMGRAAREQAAARFSADRMISETEAVLTRAAGARRSSGRLRSMAAMDRRQLQLRLRHAPDAVRLLARNPGWLKEYVRTIRAQRHTERQAELSTAPQGMRAAAAVAATLGVTEAKYRETVAELWKPEPDDTGALADWNAREELQDVIGAVVKLTRPMVVVETGVAMGLTSAVILAALESNGEGQLYSIDLPALQAKPEEFVGRAVPEEYKPRWTLELGPSRQVLPELVQHVAPIDVSLHDADHSHAGQLEEYRTVWPYLRPGGVLVSDDVRGPAFLEFAREVGAEPRLVGGDEQHAPVGIVRKA